MSLFAFRLISHIEVIYLVKKKRFWSKNLQIFNQLLEGDQFLSDNFLIFSNRCRDEREREREDKQLVLNLH